MKSDTGNSGNICASPIRSPAGSTSDPTHTIAFQKSPDGAKELVAHTFSHGDPAQTETIEIEFPPKVARLWVKACQVAEKQAGHPLEPTEVLLLAMRRLSEKGRSLAKKGREKVIKE